MPNPPTREALLREIDRPRCDATTQARWYAKAHRCPFKASVTLAGLNFCRLHAKLAAIAAKIQP